MLVVRTHKHQPRRMLVTRCILCARVAQRAPPVLAKRTTGVSSACTKGAKSVATQTAVLYAMQTVANATTMVAEAITVVSVIGPLRARVPVSLQTLQCSAGSRAGSRAGAGAGAGADENYGGHRGWCRPGRGPI